MTMRIENRLYGLLPQVAIDYLAQIVQEDRTVRIIRLVPLAQWPDHIQEIVCERECGDIVRRVFGFTPISATLSVDYGPDTTEIRLAA